jgi:hypothetical protein
MIWWCPKVLLAHLVNFFSSFTFSLQKLQEKADTYWAQPTNSHQQAHHESRGGGGEELEWAK